MCETQGTGDHHYKTGQLLPENFLNAARKAGYNDVQVRVREQVGYDHSYYFVSPQSEFSWSTCGLVRHGPRYPPSRKITCNVRNHRSLQATDASVCFSPRRVFESVKGSHC